MFFYRFIELGILGWGLGICVFMCFLGDSVYVNYCLRFILGVFVVIKVGNWELVGSGEGRGGWRRGYNVIVFFVKIGVVVKFLGDKMSYFFVFYLLLF